MVPVFGSGPMVLHCSEREWICFGSDTVLTGFVLPVSVVLYKPLLVWLKVIAPPNPPKVDFFQVVTPNFKPQPCLSPAFLAVEAHRKESGAVA